MIRKQSDKNDNIQMNNPKSLAEEIGFNAAQSISQLPHRHVVGSRDKKRHKPTKE